MCRPTSPELPPGVSTPANAAGSVLSSLPWGSSGAGSDAGKREQGMPLGRGAGGSCQVACWGQGVQKAEAVTPESTL